MSWITDVQKVAYDAQQDITAATNKAGDWFSSLVNNVQSQVGSFFKGSNVIGINANEVDNMRAAIKQYTTDLNSHLDQVKLDTDTSQAFKGEYAAATREYVAAIVASCQSIITYLNKFSDQLKEVKDAYQAQDTQMAAKIRETASATEGQFTRYEEKY